ncbi:hypothetical protein SUGI_0057860 [Cryptomeria japonica]|nr:hypothetical protein SUGI_0057860 [Cryptomeria japonica]
MVSLLLNPLCCNKQQGIVRVRAVAEAAKPVKNEAKEKTGIRVVFGAGGTGGHVYPAIAIADEMKVIHPNVEIEFVGTSNRLEWKAVPAAGYSIRPIPAVALKRPILHPTNILLPLKFLNCLWECWKLLGQLRPELVVGTGGYVAAPICLMAALRGIRIAIQEQNVSPGIANKLLGVFASVIFVAFPSSVDLFPKRKCVVSGNPIRPSLRRYVSRSVARSHFFPGSTGNSQAELLLILGGSLGANAINIAVLEMYCQMLSQHPNRYIIWQTGNDNFDEMDSLVKAHPRLLLTSYLNNMDFAYAAADLVVARAGAMTCSELLATGKPSILIPSAYVAEDHQMKNATFMYEVAGAKLLYEDELDSTTLANAINDILDSCPQQEQVEKICCFCKETLSLIVGKEK